MKRSNTTIDVRRFASDPLAFAESLVIQSARGKARFGEVMADFQRERFAAIAPALLAVARGEQPPVGRFWWEASKGTSKDGDLAICVLWLLAFSLRVITAQIAAADQDQANELRKAAKGVLYCNPWLEERIRIDKWKIVCEATSSEAEIIAADIAGSHGARPDFLVLNELSHVAKWEFVENVMDNASKIPNGIVVVATNAGSTEHPSYQWRSIAHASDRWSFHVWDKPAPWLDAKELAEAARRNPPARFARLFHGVWSTGLGDALRKSDVDAALAGNVEALGKAESGWIFTGGLDLSVSRDFTTFVVVGKHTLTGRYRVCRCKLWKPSIVGGKIDQQEVEDWIRQADKDYRLAAIGCDPFQAEYLISRLKKDRVKIEARPQSGKALVEQCLMLIEQFTSNNIDVPQAFKALEYDLRHLRVEEKSYGMRLVSDRGPEGHGDSASSLALALCIAKQAKAQRTLAIGVGGATEGHPLADLGNQYFPNWNTGHPGDFPPEPIDPVTVGPGHVAFHSLQAALNAARQEP